MSLKWGYGLLCLVLGSFLILAGCEEKTGGDVHGYCHYGAVPVGEYAIVPDGEYVYSGEADENKIYMAVEYKDVYEDEDGTLKKECQTASTKFGEAGKWVSGSPLEGTASCTYSHPDGGKVILHVANMFHNFLLNAANYENEGDGPCPSDSVYNETKTSDHTYKASVVSSDPILGKKFCVEWVNTDSLTIQIESDKFVTQNTTGAIVEVTEDTLCDQEGAVYSCARKPEYYLGPGKTYYYFDAYFDAGTTASDGQTSCENTLGGTWSQMIQNLSSRNFSHDHW